MNTEAKKEEGQETKVTAQAGGVKPGDAEAPISAAEAERIYQEELSRPDSSTKPEQQTSAQQGGPAKQTPEDKGQQTTDITDDDVKLLADYGLAKENATPKLLERIRKEAKDRADLERRAQVAEGDKNRAFLQNKELSTKYRELKERIDADPASTIEAVRDYLKSVPLDKLPEGSRKLLADEDLLTAVAVVASGMVRKRGEQEQPAPGGPEAGGDPGPAAQQIPVEEIKRRADEIENAVAAAHKDYAQVYGSPDFGAWFKEQPLETRRKISIPSAKEHIELLNAYKAHVSAKAQVAEEETKRKRDMDALRGVGHVGTRGAAGGEELSADDIMNMSDDEFKKLDQRIMSGGVRR